MGKIQKIAVVGSGAIGCYYGARLARREDVSFLMRRDLDAVRAGGLHIESVDGDFVLDPVSACATTSEIGPVDLVVIALKATSNHILPDLLPPLLTKGTALLTLQNGLGNEEFLQAHFPDHAILGGLCYVCINRGDPGQVHHLAAGKIELGGHGETKRAEEVVELFQGAGIHCQYLPDLGLARWRKLIWNVPFNGLSIAAGGLDTRKILADPRLVDRTRRLMHEIIDAARAQDFVIDPTFAESNIETTRGMGPYRPSSLIDFDKGSTVEVEAIWGEPLRRARELGVDTPELARLYDEICTAIENRAS